jgi:hypothetical protein
MSKLQILYVRDLRHRITAAVASVDEDIPRYVCDGMDSRIDTWCVTGGSCVEHLLLNHTNLETFTIPTERPPIVGEVIANFSRIDGAMWSP